MSHQFKAGDLAIIKHCSTWPEAVGRCVTLVESVPAGAKARCGSTWFLNNTNVAGWIVHSEWGFPVHSEILGLLPDHIQPVALFRELALMPLKGDEQPAQVRQAERVQ